MVKSLCRTLTRVSSHLKSAIYQGFQTINDYVTRLFSYFKYCAHKAFTRTLNTATRLVSFFYDIYPDNQNNSKDSVGLYIWHDYESIMWSETVIELNYELGYDIECIAAMLSSEIGIILLCWLGYWLLSWIWNVSTTVYAVTELRTKMSLRNTLTDVTRVVFIFARAP